MSDLINGYTLTRSWFDFAFENPSIVKPTHGIVYLWIVELSNRMGWPKEFANPGSQAMAAAGIKSYNTYKGVFDDLVEWGFIQVIKPSVNQYQACVIALSKIDKADNKALDKALAGHTTKHLQDTIQSIDSINKPQTSKPKTTNNKHPDLSNLSEEEQNIWNTYTAWFKDQNFKVVARIENQLDPNQLLKLLENYDAEEIKETLQSLENYKRAKDYTSVYLTLNKWLKKQTA